MINPIIYRFVTFLVILDPLGVLLAALVAPYVVDGIRELLQRSA